MNNFNYFTALLFDRRPDLHMTLSYHKNLTPGKLGALITVVDEYFRPTEGFNTQFKIKLNREDWFGPHGTVRVLRPAEGPINWPGFVTSLVGPTWKPHITCKDNALTVKIIALAVMCKKREIVRWNLTKAR